MELQPVITLNREGILKVLPHQLPFVFIDEVFDLIPGKSAKAYKFVAPEDPIFSCHFPGNPIYPGIFLIESAGQLAFVTFCYRPDSESSVYRKAGYLGSVKNFVFKNIVTPGMTLLIAVEVIAQFGDAAKVSAKISCRETWIAGGELYFTVAEIEKNG